ncbi:MAG TPA: hypothetical protein VK906_06300 [Egicoccus sp.]|nr:hypothetical protein [Egicoccus sp.]HSK22765.1 hypothetical protein [Egicoccus sp.]
MERTIRIFLPVPGDPAATLAAFRNEPMRWLPEGRLGERGLTSTVRAGGMSRSVLVRVGEPWVVGATHWRSLRWDPLNDDEGPGRTDRLLPAFDGELGLHVLEPGPHPGPTKPDSLPGPTKAGRITLILDGRYVPPGGSVGAALDGVAMGRVAQRSLERFLEDLAANLQERAGLSMQPQ